MNLNARILMRFLEHERDEAHANEAEANRKARLADTCSAKTKEQLLAACHSGRASMAGEALERMGAAEYDWRGVTGKMKVPAVMAEIALLDSLDRTDYRDGMIDAYRSTLGMPAKYANKTEEAR